MNLLILEKYSDYEITIFDTSGKKIFKKKSDGLLTIIPTNSFVRGFYFLNIKSTDKTITKKIIF